jgi:putative membrane protein
VCLRSICDSRYSEYQRIFDVADHHAAEFTFYPKHAKIAELLTAENSKLVIEMVGAKERRTSAVKKSVKLAFALGLGVAIVLIARAGAGDIANLLARAGWILLLLVPLQALPMLLDVLGWRALIAQPVQVSALFLIACIRQAINRLLPVANIGGEIVGARLLAGRGIGGIAATASVIVEVFVALVAQFLFVCLGLICLAWRTGDSRTSYALLAGLTIVVPALGFMILALRSGRLFFRAEQQMKRLFSRWQKGLDSQMRGAHLDAAIRHLLAARARLSAALAWQLAGYVAGSLETWLALRWLGHPVTAIEAIVIESLTQAARSLFFMVPAAVGIQEAGLIGSMSLFGLGPDVALALSLAKRMRETLFGIPALVAWHWMEGAPSRGSVLK